MGFDWGRIDAAVAAIPPGHWATYGDLAELGGTAAQAVGNRMATSAKLDNAYRVLDRTGRISAAFRWGDSGDTRDVATVLTEEGVRFGPDGAADPALRLTAYALAELIPYEFDTDELDRLRKADEAPGKVRVAQAGDELWLRDGRTWHSNMCAVLRLGPLSEELVSMIGRAAAGISDPDWGQKLYISWRAGKRQWIRMDTRSSWVWMLFRQAPFTAEEAARRLGFVYIPPGSQPSWTNEGPSQVMGDAYWPVEIQIKALGDILGDSGPR